MLKSKLSSLIAWVITLFVLTGLGVAWLWQSGVDPTEDFSPAIIVIGYAPALTALFVAGFLKGTQGIGWLLRQIITWRVGIKWYALALLGPLALVFIANVIFIAFGGEQPEQWWQFSLGSIAIGPLIAGSLGEELGWRGFAQPLLQRRFSIFWASVIIGVLWATWHSYPVFAPGGQDQLMNYDVAETYVRLISTAVLYGWLYSKTGSLLLVMLAHAGHNIAIDTLGITEGSAIIVTALYFLAAVSLVVVTREQLFVRPKSGSR